MPKKHQKHADLARPDYGQFHRHEWSILGTTCGRIKELAFALTGQLADRYRLAYVDADHKNADAEAGNGRDLKTALAHRARLEYTDKITHHRFDFEAKLEKFQYSYWFNDTDAVLVNGNHFPARHQIAVIDPKKEASLQKRLGRLTGLQLILLADGAEQPYPWLAEEIEGIDRIPVMRLQEVDRIAAFLDGKMDAARPPLYGLVLAGGKSRRMGHDKGLIDYHGKPQREHALELLGPLTERTFLSVRADQADEVPAGTPTIVDTFTGLGPFGAILSAFREHPEAAWLVIATDLPLLDQATLAQLIGRRNPSRLATAFNSPINEFPEPLVAVWEPRAYPVLLQFLAQGYSCPRKVLINSDVERIDADRPETLTNVNDPEELKRVMGLI